MVFIFGVNFGGENNVPQEQSMMTTNNNNPNCWNTNIGGYSYGGRACSRDDAASSSLPNNHYELEYRRRFQGTSSFNFCNTQFSPLPALRGHQKSHKREREIHVQENNNNNYRKVATKGKEVVKFERYEPTNSMILVPIIDLTNNDSICEWKVQEHNIFTPSKTFSCQICNRSFSSARALGGHKKAHKPKPTHAKHPQEMENFSSIHGFKIEDISIKLEDNVGESSINVDTKSNSVLHKSTVVASDYHHTVKEEPIELDLSLKL